MKRRLGSDDASADATTTAAAAAIASAIGDQLQASLASCLSDLTASAATGRRFGAVAFPPADESQVNQFLHQKLGKDNLTRRPGPGGRRLTYIESCKAIELANQAFGFNGWSCRIIECKEEYRDCKNDRWTIGFSSLVRIELKDGTSHEDVGFGQADGQRDLGAALEQAKKASISDARKRALRLFGEYLGNSCYDREHIKDVHSNKPMNSVPIPPLASPSMAGRPPLTANSAAQMQPKPPTAIALVVRAEAQPMTASRMPDQARSNTPAAAPIATPGINATITNASGSGILGQRAPIHLQTSPAQPSYAHPVNSSAISTSDSSSMPRNNSNPTTVDRAPHPSTASAIASRISALHAAEATKRQTVVSTGPTTPSVYTPQQPQQQHRQPHQQQHRQPHQQQLHQVQQQYAPAQEHHHQAQQHHAQAQQQHHQAQQQQFTRQVNAPPTAQPFASNTSIQNQPPRQFHASNAPPPNRYTGYQQPPAVKVEPRTSAVAAYEMTDLSLSQFDFDPDGDTAAANKRLRT